MNRTLVQKVMATVAGRNVDPDDRRERALLLKRAALPCYGLLSASQAVVFIADDRSSDLGAFGDALNLFQLGAAIVAAGLMLLSFVMTQGKEIKNDERERLFHVERAASAFITSVIGVFALSVVVIAVDLPGAAVTAFVMSIMLVALAFPLPLASRVFRTG